MQKNRFTVVASCLIFITLGFSFLRPVVKAPADTLPNILLIVADDLGLHDLGCYGNPVIETPHLDSLAANGIRYTRAYAASPICSPSRAAIQTGLNPARIGLTEHIRGIPQPDPCWPMLPPEPLQALALGHETLAERLKTQGYHTSYVGKWHLGGNGYGPTSQGYDVSYAAGPQGLPVSFFPPYFNGNNYPELSTIASGDDYLTEALVTLSLEAIPANADQPFFQQLSFYAPHVPIMGPPDLVEKYETIIGDNPDALPRPHYAAMVEAIDRSVGRLLAALEQRGQLENTIVLFTSDHGALTVREVPGFDAHTPPTTSGPLRDGKGYLYEGGLRVPLIVNCPQRYTPSVEDRKTSNVDFFSTFAHLAKACSDVPEEKCNTLDGQPVPAMTDARYMERPLFFHYPHYSPQRGEPGAVMITEAHKLIQWFSPVDSLYLFELDQDTAEINNLAFAKSAVADSLNQVLKNWQDSIGARAMNINPNYVEENCN
ncbi:MAG: sulfatase [Bacteroidota bacterium]